MSVQSRLANILATHEQFSTLIDLPQGSAQEFAEGKPPLYPAYSKKQKSTAIATCKILSIPADMYEEILYLCAATRPDPYKSPTQSKDLHYHNWSYQHSVPNQELSSEWSAEILAMSNRKLQALGSKLRNTQIHSGMPSKMTVIR